MGQHNHPTSIRPLWSIRREQRARARLASQHALSSALRDAFCGLFAMAGLVVVIVCLIIGGFA